MKLSITDSYLEIKFSIPEKIISMHGSLKIPLAYIKKARTEMSASPLSSAREIRMPGTHIPGIVKAGTYRMQGRKYFWYVTRKTPYLVLELDEGRQPYRRIILSVDDADSLKNTINSAIS